MSGNLQHKEEKRTDNQNRALHLFFEQLAEEMQRNEITMTAVLQKFILDAPATKYGVKEYLWKPLQLAMLGKESTRELLKKEEIDQVYDSLNKFFGETMHMTIPAFPSWENISLEEELKKI